MCQRESTRSAARAYWQCYGDECESTHSHEKSQSQGEKWEPFPYVRRLKREIPTQLWDAEWGDGVNAIEQRSVENAYTGFSALSLYCPLDIGDSKTHALVDCGAGINMANTHYIRNVMARLGGKSIEIIRDSLTVRVAHGQKWHLDRKARVSYKIGNASFRQDFWLSEDLQDDVLLGMPALRNGRTTLNIGGTPDDDFIFLREQKVKVRLEHHPYGVRHTKLALSSKVNMVLPAGQGSYMTAYLRGKHGLMWPKGTPLTGLVSGASKGNYACLPKPGLH